MSEGKYSDSVVKHVTTCCAVVVVAVIVGVYSAVDRVLKFLNS